METVRSIVFYLVLGYVTVFVGQWLESPFLENFLIENLITILIALMAINTTTMSVIMTKLKEIADRTGGDFAATIEQLRDSLVEQIWFIAIALVALIAHGSRLVAAHVANLEIVVSGVLCAVFIASLWNLYDTAQTIFVILRYENDSKA
jgi:hypothetical protein